MGSVPETTKGKAQKEVRRRKCDYSQGPTSEAALQQEGSQHCPPSISSGYAGFTSFSAQ